MTDTHTHILPGMDDGAADLRTSLQMLRRSREQGVKTVVLTPHFYPERESAGSFLERRARAFDRLQAAARGNLPRLVLGAEVAWCTGIERMEQLRELTMGNTDYLLLEMPYMAWNEEQFDSLSRLVEDVKLVPVLAHVERYLHLQNQGQYQALEQLRLPMQISAGAFSNLFTRGKALRLISSGQWMVGSDCHNLTNRPPCMGAAARYLHSHAPERMTALNWSFE